MSHSPNLPVHCTWVCRFPPPPSPLARVESPSPSERTLNCFPLSVLHMGTPALFLPAANQDALPGRTCAVSQFSGSGSAPCSLRHSAHLFEAYRRGRDRLGGKRGGERRTRFGCAPRKGASRTRVAIVASHLTDPPSGAMAGSLGP